MNPEEYLRPDERPPSDEGLPDAPAHAVALQTLAQVIAGEESQIDLGRAALLIAADHYPLLDVTAYTQKLDALAQGARKRIGRAQSPDAIVEALNAYLFDEQGFHGNADDYYNPANSFLNEVLESRGGLPITLSIVYIAIAQRLNLPVCGVGLPLHFIVRYDPPAQNGTTDQKETPAELLIDPLLIDPLLIDPFYGGEILTPERCQERIEHILGRSIAFDPAYLFPTPNRLILYRLLNNLKQVYLQREEPERAGRVVEQMLVIMPDSLEDIRDRGLLLLQERAYSRAVDWLTRYLARIPNAEDAAQIHRAIEQAYHLRAQLN